MESSRSIVSILAASESSQARKYAAVEHFAARHSAYVREANRLFPESGRRTWLDIGSGPLFTLASARAAGYFPVGIDHPDCPKAYKDVAKELDIDCHYVEVSESTHPSATLFRGLGYPDEYSVISAISTEFDRNTRDNRTWTRPEWSRFLASLSSMLTPGGGLVLKPNRHQGYENQFRDHRGYDSRIWDAFEHHSHVFRKRVFFIKRDEIPPLIAELMR